MKHMSSDSITRRPRSSAASAMTASGLRKAGSRS
jgi:hypothetical protein